MAMELIVMDKEKPISISMMEEDEYSEYSDGSEEEEYSDYEMDEWTEDESDEEKKEESDESDEDIICDRVEVDRGYTYVVQDGPTITRPKVATKTYFKRKRCYPFQHELYSYEFPLSTFANFALDRYNHIEHTKYKYVGLIKAYSRAVAGFRFWIRFKACLPDQDHDIYFQAIVARGLPDRITDVVFVDIEFVYPLNTPPVMPVHLLSEKVSSALL